MLHHVRSWYRPQQSSWDMQPSPLPPPKPSKNSGPGSSRLRRGAVQSDVPAAVGHLAIHSGQTIGLALIVDHIAIVVRSIESAMEILQSAFGCTALTHPFINDEQRVPLSVLARPQPGPAIDSEAITIDDAAREPNVELIATDAKTALLNAPSTN